MLLRKGAICTSVYVKDVKGLESCIEQAFRFGSDLVEVRVDLLNGIRLEELHKVLAKHRERLILTCRPIQERGGFDGPEEERLKILLGLSAIGPGFLDVELSLARKHPKQLRDFAKNGSSLLISWHDFERTPSSSALREKVNQALNFGDIAKVVPTATKLRDNLNVLSLYKNKQRKNVVAFCMGERGIVSRLLCTLLGSPFTYASLPGHPTAEGQPSVEELRSLLDVIRMES